MYCSTTRHVTTVNETNHSKQTKCNIVGGQLGINKNKSQAVVIIFAFSFTSLLCTVLVQLQVRCGWASVDGLFRKVSCTATQVAVEKPLQSFSDHLKPALARRVRPPACWGSP